MLNKMKSLSQFEETIVRKFCEKNDLPISNLADHIPHLQATKHEYTRVGVYIDLESSFGAEGTSNEIVSGVLAEAADGRPALGFILYIENSKPKLIEGFSYSDRWPSDLDGYELSLG